MALLKITNIKKNFGDTKVLKGIDVEIEKGEVLAIIGSSGSGKTTLLRCINFLETPDSGDIYIDDELLYSAPKDNNLSEMQLRKKRLNFGLVFQSFNLFPQYNVLQNIMLAPKLLISDQIKEKTKVLKKNFWKAPFNTDVRIEYKNEKEKLNIQKNSSKQNIEENAIKILKRVGLEEKMDSYPCELSGGQCQRVAIARALALSPRILCFDEPTSALDPELTGEVLKVIKKLKDKDNTMIIVTHEMEFARNVADKILFMANGVVVEYGTPAEVFGNPKDDRTRSFLSKNEEMQTF
ncbi:MAG: amino acid ABC transporter ATP-binding protein [Clostridia bacterium]